MFGACIRDCGHPQHCVSSSIDILKAVGIGDNKGEVLITHLFKSFQSRAVFFAFSFSVFNKAVPYLLGNMTFC